MSKKKFRLIVLNSFFFLVSTCSFAIADQIVKTGFTESPRPDNLPETPNDAQQTDANDPLEPLNRLIFGINQVIDGLLLRPLALLYHNLLPDPIQTAVGNVLDNLKSPIYFVNHILQGSPDEACTILLRFVMNSTLGIGGVIDAGSELGFPGVRTGFGDTLGFWGVDSGPYLMLPVLGASSFRDALGLGADYYTNPLNYYFSNKHHKKKRWAQYTLTGLDLTHKRAGVLTTLDELKKSEDFYASVRSVYTQYTTHRIQQIGQRKNELNQQKKSEDQKG